MNLSDFYKDNPFILETKLGDGTGSIADIKIASDLSKALNVKLADPVTLSPGGKVDQGAAGADPWPVVVTAASPITTSSLVPTAASISPVLLLAANIDRKFLSIYNASNAILFIKYGSGISSTFYNFAMPKYSYWESDFYVFTGEIWGIWSLALGQALVTELI